MELKEEKTVEAQRFKAVEEQFLEREMQMEREAEAREATQQAEAWQRTQKLRTEAQKREKELHDTIKTVADELVVARNGKEIYKKRSHALGMKVARFPQAKEAAIHRAVKKSNLKSHHNEYHVKEKHVFTNTFRGLVRDLVAETNVAVEHVEEVIRRVLSASDISVVGDISVRSVGRIILEGGVASDCQIADNIVACQGLTVSGDGTSDRNLHYESQHIRVTLLDGTVKDLALGVRTAPNHTSETQLQGWKDRSNELARTHRQVYGYDETKALVDRRDLAIKTVGANSDHSDDQKKLWRLYRVWKDECDIEKRGEESLLDMVPRDLLATLIEISETSIADVGGLERWNGLTEAERSTRYNSAYHSYCQKQGEEVVASLGDAEKIQRKEFYWIGCGMHKEMNATKGGDKGMEQWFLQNSVIAEAPMKYLNKDNRAAAESGTSAAADRAREVSKGGATKLTELAGSVFRHKDSKKGQQDTIKCWAEHILGFLIIYPDTSNIRYHSHGDAACELIVHHKFWLTLLEMVRDKKGNGTFTNLEQNVYHGLQDLPTIHELCVLSLYSQSVTHPYLRLIRGGDSEIVNGLDLGPLHKQLLAFLRKVIDNPDVLLSSEVTWETASFDGKPWDRPEAFYAVQQRSTELPYLRPLLVAFFKGALETWERFNAEFADDGAIAQATDAQLARVSLPTTNDLNEGVLGSKRRVKRSCPNMSNHAYNSRKNYRFNNTAEYVETMPAAAQKNLRQVAREIDASGLVRKERERQAAHDEEVARTNREKAAARAERAAELAEQIKQTQVMALELLTNGLTVKVISSQLQWHRFHRKRCQLKMPTIPGKKTKADKLMVLKEVAAEYWDSIQEADSQGERALTTNNPPSVDDLLDLLDDSE